MSQVYNCLEEDRRALPDDVQATILAVEDGLADCPFTLCDHHGGVVMVTEMATFPPKAFRLFSVFCNSCNARGPRLTSARSAADVWNERDPAKQVDVGP